MSVVLASNWVLHGQGRSHVDGVIKHLGIEWL